MTARLVLLVGALIAVAVTATPASAQQGGPCEIVSGEFMDVLDRGTPSERVVLRINARILCDDGVELQADTAISHAVSGVRQFIGGVVYTDSAKSLTADRVDYFADINRLQARGSVVLTDRESGSVIRGEALDYTRDEAETSTAIVTGGRPHATLYRTSRDVRDERDDEADEADNTPLEVDADRMELFGENRFLAFGDVVLDQGEVEAFADEVEYDAQEDYLILIGQARVQDSAYTMTADRIEALLEGEDLREVIAEGESVLLAEELRVDAPAIRILLEDGEVHRMIAMKRLLASSDATGAEVALEDEAGDGARGAEEAVAETGTPRAKRAVAAKARIPDGEDAGADEAGIPSADGGSFAETGDDELPQPRAIATDFWITADSIDALSPGQTLREVIAVGSAYGERIEAEPVPGLPESIARDWLSGDTIIAYFAEEVVDASAELDTEAAAEEDPERRVVLERLVSIGSEGRARSVYRMQEDDRPEGELSINYMVANRISLFFRDGEVTQVEAEGPLRGVHLQPTGGRGGEGEAGRDDPVNAATNGT